MILTTSTGMEAYVHTYDYLCMLSFGQKNNVLNVNFRI